MGLLQAFMEDDVITFGLVALKKQPRKKLQEAAAQETMRLLQMSREDRTQQLRALLGPRGGLPRLKDELIKAAALLNEKLDKEATVDQIRKQLQPTVKALIGKPDWQAPELPQSPSTAAAKAKPKPSAARTPQIVNLASQDGFAALRNLPPADFRKLRLQEPRPERQAWDTQEVEDSPIVLSSADGRSNVDRHDSYGYDGECQSGDDSPEVQTPLVLAVTWKELPTRPPPAVVPPIPTAQPHAVEASVAESGDAASTTALVMVKQARRVEADEAQR
eukprot:g8172.t1